MSTVKLDLNEYNRLRDRDELFKHLEADEVVFYKSLWHGGIYTKEMDKKEAWIKLTNDLADSQFKLQMANEEIARLKAKKKRWL